MSEVHPPPGPRPHAGPRHFPVRIAVVIAVLAVAGVAVLGYRGSQRGGEADPRTASGASTAGNASAGRSERPSILLITLDTTRADHLSAYGYARPTSPTLTSLLPDSVRFDAAQAPMPTTLPSHATMFTGRYPHDLGLLKNGQVLSDDAVTLAELLSAAGWRTAGFVSSFVLDRRFGPMQGFATYDDKFSDVPCKMLGKNWEGRDLETSFCRRGAETVERAGAWLESNGYLRAPGAGADDLEPPPFFLFVHLFDPHNPYVPEEAHAALFPPLVENPTRLEREIADYDAEIHYADAQVAKLLERLRAAGRLDDTIVVITADHGEGLMQHGWMHHGMQIYEEAVHVPLIVRWPGPIAGGRTIAAPVGLADLAPTLLELAGLPDGLHQPAGRSLAPVLLGDASADPERAIFLQRRLYETPVVRDIPVKGFKYGVRQGTWKYIEAKDEGTRELYDLREDPGERENVVELKADEADRLSALIASWTAAEPGSSGSRVAPDDAERLRALGYVE